VIEELARLDLWDVGLKIGLAALLGGAVGAEREWTGKWAGLRTHMLIAVGSALLTHISVLVGPLYAQGSDAWDPGRIAAQIVSGVGFIGAGTIIQSRGAVHGLTTAAGLWVASAIGIGVGAGLYGESVVTTVVLLLILTGLRPVERRLLRGRRTVLFSLRSDASLPRLTELLKEAGIEAEQLSITRGDEGLSVLARFRGSAEDARRLIQKARDESVSAAEGQEE
jgi:putative Mg2+ transporter-C (MgtC) family protein